MTFPRLEAFEREWRRRPPLAWIVPAFLGYKPPPTVAQKAASTRAASIADLDAMFPNGNFRGG